MEDFPEIRVAVFFYGLFMDRAVLAAKGITPFRAVVGYVDGYGLRIGERATLVPDAEDRAHGILMTIRAGEADALYSEESVADYIAEPVTVTLPDGTAESAVCYNLRESELAGTNPEYARALLAVARDLGFPGAYLRRIETYLD